MNRFSLDRMVVNSSRPLCAVGRHLRAVSGEAALSEQGEHGEAGRGKMNKEARGLWGRAWKFKQTDVAPAQLGREVGCLEARRRPECV